MSTQTEAERLADALDCHEHIGMSKAAAEMRRLVSFNQQLMDEVDRLKNALAEQPAQHEPVYHLRQYGDVTKEQLDRYMATGDINPQPARRTWVGLTRGVRVEGDTVVITVKGGNDAARELYGALLEEKNNG